MKRFFQSKQAAIILLIISGGLGASLAQITLQYEIVVRGILGMVTIALIFLYSGTLIPDKKLEDVFKFPENIKLFSMTFFWALISFWATDQIYIMILFLFVW